MNDHARASIADADVPTVRMLTADGRFEPNAEAVAYLPHLERLTDEDHRTFYRDMARTRRLDDEASNLQRQGQLSLWVPSVGQEAAQVGSARAAQPQDHLFPSYREHAAALIRGVKPVDVVATFRGGRHAGWRMSDPSIQNFHIYTLVVGAQTLHATGFALGAKLDADRRRATPGAEERPVEAVLVYFGDGATSQGDVNEALVFAASYQTPQVFFLQNNHFAISVPVSTQSRVPLYLRAGGFGVPGVRIDGNDVLAAFAVTAKHLDDARAGLGPAFIEAVTYRIGAHTTSDDPTKYRSDDELSEWGERDPLVRYRRYLEGLGVEQSFFGQVDRDAADEADELRRAIMAETPPPIDDIFTHVYTDQHAPLAEQRAWLSAYEAALDEEGGA